MSVNLKNYFYINYLREEEFTPKDIVEAREACPGIPFDKLSEIMANTKKSVIVYREVLTENENFIDYHKILEMINNEDLIKESKHEINDEDIDFFAYNLPIEIIKRYKLNSYLNIEDKFDDIVLFQPVEQMENTYQ